MAKQELQDERFPSKGDIFLRNIGVKECSPSFGKTLEDEIKNMTPLDVFTFATTQEKNMQQSVQHKPKLMNVLMRTCQQITPSP